MDKVTSALRPYQVRIRAESIIMSSVRVRTVLGIPLSGIVGIEQVLSTLPVLDVHLAQQAVQLLSGHVQFLGELGGCDASDGVEYMVGIIRTRFYLGYLLITA